MAFKVNWETWVAMLREDIAHLRTLPPTLETEHTITILECLATRETGMAFYAAMPEPTPEA